MNSLSLQIDLNIIISHLLARFMVLIEIEIAGYILVGLCSVVPKWHCLMRKLKGWGGEWSVHKFDPKLLFKNN